MQSEILYWSKLAKKNFLRAELMSFESHEFTMFLFTIDFLVH